MLIHTQSPVDRPTLRSVIVSFQRGRTRITRRKLYGQPPLPTTTSAQARPCCSPDNNHGCQHVVGRLMLTARPPGLWTSSRAFRQAIPTRTPCAEGPRQDCCDPIHQHSERQRYHRAGLISASHPESVSRPPDRISTSLNDIGLPLQGSPKRSRHGILLHLGVRDITLTCLLWEEEDISKLGRHVTSGILT